jgi:hypothetical protein
VESEDVAQDEHGELARRQDLKSGHESQGDRLGLFVASLRPERHVHHTLEDGVWEWLEPYDFAEPGRLGRFILGDVPLLGRASAGRRALRHRLVRSGRATCGSKPAPRTL